MLVVRDEKTGEISVVAGLNADGTPKRTPAKAENAQSFLQFDRHGDVLDNFFKNFFRQCKEPSRFGFYRIAADQVDSMLGVMKDLLKASVPEQTNPCTAQNRHLPAIEQQVQEGNGGTKDRETRTSKTGRTWNNRKNRTGKPATDAGQTGLPTHRREQNQLAGTGGQMGREA